MNRVLLIPTVLLLILGSVCLFITRSHTAGTRPLVFCNADDIKTLDPGKMSWQNDIRTAMGMWEGLTAYDPKTLEPVPGVAESWTISPDGKTYTFHLRSSARWSNGDPVVAQDFLFAWQRVLTPATAADYVNLFFPIKGAEDYYNALDKNVTPAPSFSSVGIRSPDPHTIVIELANPCGYYLDLVAFSPYYPLHEKSMRPFLLDPADPAKGYDGAWTRPPAVVSNGPFQLTEWLFKRHLRLTFNPYYWDRAAVKTDTILIQALDDPRTALLAYQQGDVDVLSFVPQQFGELLLKQRDEKQRTDIQYRPVFGTYYFVYNCQKKPFDDKRIRKALALAIDKKKLVEEVTRMCQAPCNLLVPPDSIPFYRSPAGLPMDIAEARRLLAAAGFPGGQGFPAAEILYNNEAVHEKIAQAIGQMWQANLGIAVTFRGIERSSFGTDRRQHNFTIARGGWYGDYMDPATWLDLAKTNDGNNDGLFSSPAYDALLKQAAAEPDRDKRFAILRRAEQLLVEDEFPFIPLYQYSDGYIFDPAKIEGLDLNVRLLTQFKYIHRK